LTLLNLKKGSFLFLFAIIVNQKGADREIGLSKNQTSGFIVGVLSQPLEFQ
jgi:hypothetical protein